MARLSERQGIEILMMIIYGKHINQQETSTVFDGKYTDRLITKSTVNRIY